jgi:hypothetical protein
MGGLYFCRAGGEAPEVGDWEEEPEGEEAGVVQFSNCSWGRGKYALVIAASSECDTVLSLLTVQSIQQDLAEPFPRVPH